MSDTKFIDPQASVKTRPPVGFVGEQELEEVRLTRLDVGLSLLGQLLVGFFGGILGCGLTLLFLKLWGMLP